MGGHLVRAMLGAYPELLSFHSEVRPVFALEESRI